jgi:hypothetical protein
LEDRRLLEAAATAHQHLEDWRLLEAAATAHQYLEDWRLLEAADTNYLRYVTPTCPALLAMATLEASTWRIGGCWRLLLLLLLLIFLTANLRPAQGIMPSTLRQNQIVYHELVVKQ